VFDVLRELEASLTLISPVNHEPDSVKQVQLLTERLGNQAGYVVVKNHSFSGQFTIYDKSKTRSRLLNELGGKEIEMPKLYDWLVIGLNQAGCAITPALHHPKFTVMDRQRLKNWQRKFNEQIELARDLLLQPQSKHRPRMDMAFNYAGRMRFSFSRRVLTAVRPKGRSVTAMISPLSSRSGNAKGTGRRVPLLFPAIAKRSLAL